ncbi:MAG: ABC transporter substrate-binding protein [Pseudomonadota bacterium]
MTLRRPPRTDFATPTRRDALTGLGVVGAAAILPRRAAATGGTTLRIRSEAPLTELDPAFARAVTDEEVLAPIYSKLIQYRPGREWGWQLDAAAEIEQIDKRHIRFALRDDIGFTNGFGPLTADDVKHSLERIADPATGSPNRADLGAFLRVQTIGEREGVIVFGDPFAPIWTIALPYLAGNILSRQALLQAPDGRFSDRVLASSGPYMLPEQRAGERTTLEANPDWRGATPGFERIEIVPIADQMEAETAFVDGDVAFTEISLGSVPGYRTGVPRDGRMQVFPSLDYVWVGMNLDNPKLKDPALRQAIQHAIDVPTILDAAYVGAPKPATGILPPGVIGHRSESSVPPTADFVRAIDLMKESGARDVSLTIDLPDERAFVKAAEVMRTTLAVIGVTLEIRTHAPETFWSLGVEAKGDAWQDLELVMNRFSMPPDPYYATAWFTQRQIGVWNWERFRSNEFDALHDAAFQEADPERRGAFYERAQALMEKSGAYRFLTHGARPVVWEADLRPALRPDGRPLLRYFERI